MSDLGKARNEIKTILQSAHDECDKCYDNFQAENAKLKAEMAEYIGALKALLLKPDDEKVKKLAQAVIEKKSLGLIYLNEMVARRELIDKLKARVEKLEKALTPFAGIYNRLPKHKQSYIYNYKGDEDIFRCAAEALNQPTDKEEN